MCCDLKIRLASTIFADEFPLTDAKAIKLQ